MTIQVAGAPVSFGVFELTPSTEGIVVPSPDEVAEALVTAGYTGIDLGPVGFLGDGVTLPSFLRRHGLDLAGGWIELPFSDPDAFAVAYDDTLSTLDLMAQVAEHASGLAPKPTFADAGSVKRKQRPGGGPGLSLTPQKWDAFARSLDAVAEAARERGLEPTFHHHACTFIETPDEVDTLLDRVDIGLTFDTGHVLIGGGDPLACWRRWRERVNHLHVKDVDLPTLHAALDGGGVMLDVWTSGCFVPLGEGSLDIDSLLAEALDGYNGWLVVEQDLYPDAVDHLAQITTEHVRNRAALRKWV